MGVQGRQGTQGLQGKEGTAQGSQGTQASQGTQGHQGLQGLQGQAGQSQGTQGTQATQGVQGLQGLQGFKGDAQGTQGTQSAQGTQGRQGPQATQGVQGNQGVQGTAAAKQFGGQYGFDNGGGNSDPLGSGGAGGVNVGYFKVLQVASPTLALAPASWTTGTNAFLNIDEIDFNNVSLVSIFQAVNNVAGGGAKAVFTLSRVGDNNTYSSFYITANGTDVGNYWRFPIQFIATNNSGSILDEGQFNLTISLIGSQGVQGLQGNQGTQGIQGIQGNQGVQGGNSETSLIVALGDEFTNIGIGTSVVMFRVPFKCRITEPPTIQLSSPATVGVTSVDVLYNARFASVTSGVAWTSLFQTNAQVANIAVGQYDSFDGFQTLPVLNDNTGVKLNTFPGQILNRNDKIRFDIIGIGTPGKGLKATIYYSRVQ